MIDTEKCKQMIRDEQRSSRFHQKWNAVAQRQRLNDAAPDLLAACEAALDLTLKYARPSDDSGYQASNLLTIRLREVIATAKGDSK